MYQVIRKASLAVVFAMSFFIVGCAGPAPNYAPSIDNVEAFKKSGGEAAKVGTISVKADLPGGTVMKLRGNSMFSPRGENFGDYIAFALRQDLELAKMFSAQSDAEISGTLLRNNIDAGGMSTNEGQIEARFVVKRGGQVRFDKIKRIEHRWESAITGPVAIPLAMNNYPVMVQKLIGTLVSDPDFVQSIRN
jgi:hypothetical protein